jgi:hypothetical protein
MTRLGFAPLRVGELLDAAARLLLKDRTPR